MLCSKTEQMPKEQTYMATRLGHAEYFSIKEQDFAFVSKFIREKKQNDFPGEVQGKEKELK